MKKKFLKTVAFGLVTTMTATTLLAGCGSKEEKTADGGKEVTLTLIWLM